MHDLAGSTCLLKKAQMILMVRKQRQTKMAGLAFLQQQRALALQTRNLPLVDFLERTKKTLRRYGGACLTEWSVLDVDIHTYVHTHARVQRERDGYLGDCLHFPVWYYCYHTVNGVLQPEFCLLSYPVVFLHGSLVFSFTLVLPITYFCVLISYTHFKKMFL